MNNEIRSVLLFVLGGIVAVLIPLYPMDLFRRWLEKLSGMAKPSEEEKKAVVLPTWFVGGFERFLAFVLVLLDVPGAYTILAGWIGAKLAANWQRVPMDNSKRGQEVRARTQIALIAGIVSVGFGCLVGLSVRHMM
jgi:hypothetical protein